MVVARRLEAMGSDIPGREIVGDVYRASNWTCTPQWTVFECPECGRAHLGADAVLACCGDE